jgi:hypothetical protein
MSIFWIATFALKIGPELFHAGIRGDSDDHRGFVKMPTIDRLLM